MDYSSITLYCSVMCNVLYLIGYLDHSRFISLQLDFHFIYFSYLFVSFELAIRQ
jgi:hypothetical protein